MLYIIPTAKAYVIHIPLRDREPYWELVLGLGLAQ